MTRRTQTMIRKSRRALRPGFDDLEGRQLLSVLPETSPSAPAIATFNGDTYIAWGRHPRRDLK
jgi:hypothetical protein